MPYTQDQELRQTMAGRLLQARKIMGLSLRALEQKLGGKVSYNALHKYEKGEMAPSSDVLIALSDALGKPTDFFLRPIRVAIEGIEFRKRTVLGAKGEQAVRQTASEFFERYLEIEEILGIAGRFENPLGTEGIVKSPADVEAAAAKLRRCWSLGLDALPAVVTLLEEKHVKVLEIEADEGFDGFSGWANDVPVIVLNKRHPADRKRLTALHELGHLIIDFGRNGVDPKTREKLCLEFGGAVLLPAKVLRSELGVSRSRISTAELVSLKERYGISCAAIVKRAEKLGIVSPSFMKHFWIEWGKRGHRRSEPGVWRLPEESRRFEQLVIRAVTQELISESRGAAALGKPLSEFRENLEILP